MSSIRIARGAAIGLAGALTASGALAAGAVGSANGCKKTTLTGKNSGRSLVMHVCDSVTIRLAEQADGGYSWSVSHPPRTAVLKLTTNKTLPAQLPPGAVGGAATHVFVYRAAGKGRTSLTLIESRSFEKNSQISKFTLSVRVK